MSEDTRKLCVICAWRANCAKKFNMGDIGTLHCPDFTEDLLLHKQQKDTDERNDKES